MEEKGKRKGISDCRRSNLLTSAMHHPKTLIEVERETLYYLSDPITIVEESKTEDIPIDKRRGNSTTNSIIFIDSF